MHISFVQLNILILIIYLSSRRKPGPSCAGKLLNIHAPDRPFWVPAFAGMTNNFLLKSICYDSFLLGKRPSKICESDSVVRLEKEIPDAAILARGLVYGSPLIDQIRARGGVEPERIVDALAQAFRREFGTDPGRMPLQAIVFSARKPL